MLLRFATKSTNKVPDPSKVKEHHGFVFKKQR